MGVEHSGSDKGTETSDKPTKPDNASGPPPDNPGSPGQQSRIESLKAAGWNFNDQQESGGERGQKNDESSSTEASTENASAGPKTEKQIESEAGSQPGEGKSEPGHPKSETAEAAPPDEGKGGHRTTEPREQHPKADVESQSKGERNGEAVESREPLGGEESRTESTDKPRTDGIGEPRPETLEPSKPMTRRESLQNAGWDLGDPPATGTDQTPSEKTDRKATPPEAQDGRSATVPGDSQVGETTPQDRHGPVVAESKTNETGDLGAPTDKQDTGKSPTDNPEPQLGETGPKVEQSGEEHPQDGDTSVGDPPTTNTTGATDWTPKQPPEAQIGSGDSETRPSQEKDPRQNAPEAPPATEQPSGTDKPAAETTDADPQPAAPETATVTPESTDHGSRPQERQPEQSPAAADKTENASADRSATGDAPPSPAEGGDHDKKAGETELPDPFPESNPSDRPQTQSSETEEPGSERSTHGENLPEAEPNPYRAKITLRRDSDGNFIQERRFDVEGDTPGRAEPRKPEDDPASRDYQESDPERRPDRRDFMREFAARADDIKDGADKFSEPAQKHFDEVRPTGQLCGTRPVADQMKPPDNTIKGGSLVLAAAGTWIIVTEVGRVGLRIVQHMRGRENVGNR